MWIPLALINNKQNDQQNNDFPLPLSNAPKRAPNKGGGESRNSLPHQLCVLLWCFTDGRAKVLQLLLPLLQLLLVPLLLLLQEK